MNSSDIFVIFSVQSISSLKDSQFDTSIEDRNGPKVEKGIRSAIANQESNNYSKRE